MEDKLLLFVLGAVFTILGLVGIMGTFNAIALIPLLMGILMIVSAFIKD